jgi:excisionase family DNA binding protein
MSQHSPSPVEPLAYRTPDACRALGIGKTKLFELLKDGTLKRVRVGTRVLVTAASLRAVAEDGAE